MSDLKDFNWTGFWNDVDYALNPILVNRLLIKILKQLKQI